MGQGRDGEDRRCQNSERGDDPRARRIEVLEAVPKPADRERKPEDAIGEDRADQRGLDEL
jgi:hypothetical protein